jgi:very-long-chain (3R)-3-hydroxyacyl-CoA dehydratase
MAIKDAYLLVYNTVSFILWAYITCSALVQGAILYRQNRLQHLYTELLSPLLTRTQSLAFLEILHASSGLIRASTLTTAIQITGKNLVVWTVMVQFPEIIIGSAGQGAPGKWGFFGCLCSWGLSEVVRFGYFTATLSRGDAPTWLRWLR